MRSVAAWTCSTLGRRTRSQAAPTVDQSSDPASRSASTIASSMAIAAPWAQTGPVAWAASPTSVTRPWCQRRDPDLLDRRVVRRVRCSKCLVDHCRDRLRKPRVGVGEPGRIGRGVAALAAGGVRVDLAGRDRDQQERETPPRPGGPAVDAGVGGDEPPARGRHEGGSWSCWRQRRAHRRVDAVRGHHEVEGVLAPVGEVDRHGAVRHRLHRRHCRVPLDRDPGRQGVQHHLVPGADRAGGPRPERRLVDGEHQSPAVGPVLPSSDRHTGGSDDVGDAEGLQRRDGVAGQVEREPCGRPGTAAVRRLGTQGPAGARARAVARPAMPAPTTRTVLTRARCSG